MGRKKPKGMPKRPLSAYNLFFQDEREKALKACAVQEGLDPDAFLKELNEKREKNGRRLRRKLHGRFSFGDLASYIAGRWNELDAKSKAPFEAKAKEDKKRYKAEIAAWMDEVKDKEPGVVDKGNVEKCHDKEVPACQKITKKRKLEEKPNADTELKGAGMPANDSANQGEGKIPVNESCSWYDSLRLAASRPVQNEVRPCPKDQQGGRDEPSKKPIDTSEPELPPCEQYQPSASSTSANEERWRSIPPPPFSRAEGKPLPVRKDNPSNEEQAACEALFDIGYSQAATAASLRSSTGNTSPSSMRGGGMGRFSDHKSASPQRLIYNRPMNMIPRRGEVLHYGPPFQQRDVQNANNQKQTANAAEHFAIESNAIDRKTSESIYDIQEKTRSSSRNPVPPQHNHVAKRLRTMQHGSPLPLIQAYGQLARYQHLYGPPLRGTPSQPPPATPLLPTSLDASELMESRRGNVDTSRTRDTRRANKQKAGSSEATIKVLNAIGGTFSSACHSTASRELFDDIHQLDPSKSMEEIPFHLIITKLSTRIVELEEQNMEVEREKEDLAETLAKGKRRRGQTDIIELE